ncbi:MAG: helix-hairpin-helix domain-containing protein [Deltaproteobacteria bacterium]|nr:helix-hairpin-helix domain-containing protein [Deltaproteobacteria bacterium]
MKHSGRQITSLLFILLLVCIGLKGYFQQRHSEEITNQKQFEQQHCDRSKAKSWQPPRRQLCGIGIFLNSDNAKALAYLPGIGPKRANAIVAFRKKHGLFKHVADLKKVKGIGPTLVQRIAPWIEDVPQHRKMVK